MNFSNVKTTITAYPKLSPGLLSNYVQEAPVDGKTYARKDEKWVEIRPSNIHFYYGTTDTFSITSDQILTFKEYTPELEFKDQSVVVEVQTQYPTVGGDVAGGSVVWFCANTKIASITQNDVGNWPIDYVPQVGVLDVDGTQYYCYHTTTALVPNKWKFTVTFDIDTDGCNCGGKS